MNEVISNKLKHFWHVVSNVRPIVWIGLYICLVPVFAAIYYAMPAGQFRIPDGAPTDYGSWLYYSIVTITTLGFGDYTPAHSLAQGVTAIEVMCGLVFLGFFLNSVGSMKSEIDVESELEKQRLAHEALEREKFRRNLPILIQKLNVYLSKCEAVTKADAASRRRAAERLMSCASSTSLYLDSLQQHVDLTLWPKVLEDSFAFVAACQMFVSDDMLRDWPQNEVNAATPAELDRFITDTSKLARNLQQSAISN